MNGWRKEMKKGKWMGGKKEKRDEWIKKKEKDG